jgi:hypothetical protein
MSAGTAGRALSLDIEIGQSRALGRQLVDTGSRCTACDTPAIATHLAVTEVVHQNENDVWLRRRLEWNERMRYLGQRGSSPAAKCGHGGKGNSVTQHFATAYVLLANTV